MLRFRSLALGLLARRLASELGALRRATEAQNALLARLADHFAPAPAAHSATDVAQLSGVDHLDSLEAGLVLDFIAKTRRDTGHTPDDDEILTYLADEQTTDLHSRLRARTDELERLRRDR